MTTFHFRATRVLAREACGKASHVDGNAQRELRIAMSERDEVVASVRSGVALQVRRQSKLLTSFFRKLLDR